MLCTQPVARERSGHVSVFISDSDLDTFKKPAVLNVLLLYITLMGMRMDKLEPRQRSIAVMDCLRDSQEYNILA
jgi:hypothetical protein